MRCIFVYFPSPSPIRYTYLMNVEPKELEEYLTAALGAIAEGVEKSRRFVIKTPIEFDLAVTNKKGGGDWRNFEPVSKFSFANLDKSIKKLSKIYRGKPKWFEVSVFAQKIYKRLIFSLN